MSAPKHTPGPWRLYSTTTGWKLYAEREHQDEVVATMHSVIRDGEESNDAEANAARIVACVNFCEGYDNETLEKGPSLKELVIEYGALAALRQRYAEAIEALKATQPFLQQSNALPIKQRFYANAAIIIAVTDPRTRASSAPAAAPAKDHLTPLERELIRALLASRQFILGGEKVTELAKDYAATLQLILERAEKKAAEPAKVSCQICARPCEEAEVGMCHVCVLEYHACRTGDCEHQKQTECDAVLAADTRSLGPHSDGGALATQEDKERS